MTSASDHVESGDGDEEPEPIEMAFIVVVFWALASTTTATSYVYGLGYTYFEVLGLLLVATGSCLIYHHRASVREWWADRRERWRKAGEPIDPDEVIDDVVDDGNDDGGLT